ncbi:FtsX-like permease family protein [Bacillus paranthracis]
MAYSIAATAIDSLQYIIQMQSAFFSIVALFAFLTAVLTIGNQVVIRLMQQTRDVAIMKTVGMSSSNLMKSILLENTIISLSAGLVGAGIAPSLFRHHFTLLIPNADENRYDLVHFRYTFICYNNNNCCMDSSKTIIIG